MYLKFENAKHEKLRMKVFITVTTIMRFHKIISTPNIIVFINIVKYLYSQPERVG